MVIVATALTSFVIGILVSSGLQLRFGGDERAAAPRTPPPPATAVPPPVPTPAATAVASATPSSEPVAETTADPEVAVEPGDEEQPGDEAEADGPPTPVSTRPIVKTPDDAAELPAHKAHLLVHTDIKDAHVYVHGKYAGAAGEKHEVDCGMKFVRLGTSPNTGWLEPGRALEIPCRTFVTVTIEPRPAYQSAGPQFLK
jgi:hypothetical protein